MYWGRSSATIRAGFSRSCQSSPPGLAWYTYVLATAGRVDEAYTARKGNEGGEGVVADAEGIIYSAEVGPRAVKRYVRYIDP